MSFWNRTGSVNQHIGSIASEFSDTAWGWYAEKLLNHPHKANSQAQLNELLTLAEMGLSLSSAKEERRRALSLALLDYPLSARYNPYWRQAVGDFYQRSMSRALEEIAETEVHAGWRVWKIYNMGFVVKTANHIIGFDIHPGWVFQTPLNSKQQDTLADVLDILFISHYHADHLNTSFVQKMVDRKKPVILPASGWRLPTAGRLTPSSKRFIGQSQESHQAFDGLHVHSYLGAQWRVIRNAVYVVEVDDQFILHPGDNENLRIYDHIAENYPIDLYLANCWAQLGSSIQRIQPRTVITGHEQEISHPSRFLHSFSGSLKALAKLRKEEPQLIGKIDAHVLSWGEQYQDISQLTVMGKVLNRFP